MKHSIAFHPSLLIAPFVGIAFAVFCIAGNAGPGAFFLSLVMLLVFVFIQPPIQLRLMKTEKCRGKPWDAWFLAMFAVVAPMGILVAVGTFSFA